MEVNGKWIANSRVSGTNMAVIGMNVRVSGCLSTCCLSYVEAPGEGISVKCGYIYMD